jgi:hypothetical protein
MRAGAATIRRAVLEIQALIPVKGLARWMHIWVPSSVAWLAVAIILWRMR